MKRNTNALFVTIIGILLCVFLVYTVINGNKLFRHRKARLTYPKHENFGVQVPQGYSILGIDVSRYQQRILWHRVRKMKDNGRKIDFVFIKATQGVSLIDPYLQANVDSAEVHKIIKGVYHYFEPEIDGKEQAMHFLKHAKISAGDLLPVVDVERLDGADHIELRDRLKDWLDTVERATGVKPIIYTGATFYNSYLAGVFSSYPLWVAHYTSGTEPKVRRDWHFWQYAESATVDGISGYVDLNVFKGDSADFGRMVIQ